MRWNAELAGATIPSGPAFGEKHAPQAPKLVSPGEAVKTEELLAAKYVRWPAAENMATCRAPIGGRPLGHEIGVVASPEK
jgi:hypothetical protein